MTAITLLTLVLAVFALSGIAAAGLALWQTRALAGSVQTRLDAAREESEERALALDARLQNLAGQVHELERQPAVTLTPGVPKPGMNVVKRAHALRLHRRGERPEQIASALDLPRQEVDLLLKVHTIVIRNM
ncbi:MAG TPA: hypothetical protein VML19_32455 [Verrucomicrobiae bacterium]|nr:hypothetical protein [Verrucomicrobiae bacterium]